MERAIRLGVMKALLLLLPLFLSACGPTTAEKETRLEESRIYQEKREKRLVALAVRLPKDVPDFLTSENFSSASLARAVNHYVAMGEAASVRELRKMGKIAEEMDHWDLPLENRVFWLTRVLFEEKAAPLRGPMLGWLFMLPREAHRSGSLPYFPLVEQDGVFFVLSGSYFLAGVAEQYENYVKYLQDEGSFRKTRLKVPSKERAMAALETLSKSKKWQAMGWSGQEGGGAEGSVLFFMRQQASDDWDMFPKE